MIDDGLPCGPSAGHAVRSLGGSFEIVPPCAVCAWRRDMLEGEHLSIVVGNAQPDLMDWARSAQGGGAAAGRPLLVGAHRAAGILEGLRTLGFRD